MATATTSKESLQFAIVQPPRDIACQRILFHLVLLVQQQLMLLPLHSNTLLNCFSDLQPMSFTPFYTA
ncbi:uncharacterized protein Dana_GF27792 [Drosophila ananassae]|uniref:Uncharacterized protein n=1 Tax=Drosophila ananassae TaxID=7217 RepID=A0A0P8Y4C8_DROAN|nr:uncharacterized protein Dana_GF27792 [Drosophila ananassae]